MSYDDEKEEYLDEEIDENKLSIDLSLIMKESDSEEDKEYVRQERIKLGITNETMNTEINKINSDSSNYYDDEDEDENENDDDDDEYDEDEDEDDEFNSLTPVEDKETIAIELIENEKDITLKNEISTINQKYEIKHYQNQCNTYTEHYNQMHRNELKKQRTYNSNISNYENQKSIDEYKSNDKKEQLTKIEIQSQILLDKINEHKNHLRLWRYKEKYYCRVCEGILVDNVENGVLIKEIEKKFKRPTKIVEVNELISPKTQNITQSKLYQFILLNHIPVITDIKFNPKEDEFFEEDGVMYQNTFKYTKYLKKRFNKRLYSYV